VSAIAFVVFFTIGWAIWAYTIGTAIHEFARPRWWDERPRLRVPVAVVLGCWTMTLLTLAVFGMFLAVFGMFS
jgi:uncharacterized membrane protein YhdT